MKILSLMVLVLTLSGRATAQDQFEPEAAPVGEARAIALVDRSPVWAAADQESKLLGTLKLGTHVTVLAKRGAFYQIESKTAGGGTARGYALREDFRILGRKARRRFDDRSERRDDFNRWSFGGGFGGYSSNGKSSVTVSLELRYLWTAWTETIFGGEVNFADETTYGLRAAERFYLSINDHFVPFVQGGFRVLDLRTANSSAVEAGGGLQFAFSRHGYFELSALYLYREPFDKNASNLWLFGGGSGVRF